MVEESSFHFALLRVSIIQILKASGFDKCKPSVVNILTDLYIHYFKLLLLKSLKYANHRLENLLEIGSIGQLAGNDGLSVQDITQAMLDIGFLKPSLGENILDAFDTPPYSNVKDYSTKSAKSFKNWILYSDGFTTLKKLNKVPKPLIKNLIEKRKIDNTDEQDKDTKDKKSKRLKEKQDYYNHFKDPTGADKTEKSLLARDPEEDDEDLDQFTWLNYISEKDLKLGYDMKFINSALDSEIRQLLPNENLHPIENMEQKLQAHLNNLYKFDHILIEIEDESNGNATGANNASNINANSNASGVTVTPELSKALPYNLKYNKLLLEEPLDEYFEYTQRKREEGEEEEPEVQEKDLDAVLPTGDSS